MSHCLVTEAVDGTVEHLLMSGSMFGDVAAALSMVANRHHSGELEGGCR